MNHLILLPGIVIAAAIFFAFAATVVSIFHTQGRARHVAIAAAGLTVATMAMISLQSPLGATLAGILLIVASAVAAAYEKGTARIWPLILALFGAAAAYGLPFM